MPTPYDIDLDRNPANYQPLTPLTFLERAAAVFPDQTAIIHGKRAWTYANSTRARQAGLGARQARHRARRHRGGDAGQHAGDARSHYGVPMTGGVLNTLNTRLDAAIIAFTLDHAEAKVLITDREFSKVMKEALRSARRSRW